MINAVSHHLFSYLSCALLLGTLHILTLYSLNISNEAFLHAGLEDCPVLWYEKERCLLLILYEILTVCKNSLLLVNFTFSFLGLVYIVIAKDPEALEVALLFSDSHT